MHNHADKPINRPKAPRSLVFTLAFAFIALTVIALLVAGSVRAVFNFRTQQTLIAGRQQTIARAAGITVSSFIREKVSVLETAARIANLAEVSKEEQRRILACLLGFQPSFRQLVLMDAAGRQSAKVSRLSLVASGQMDDQLKGKMAARLRQHRAQISSVYIDNVTSEPMICIAVPIADIFGDFRGTLVGEVNLKFMWDLVDQLKVGGTGLAYVVDDRGELIAFSDIGRVLKGENLSRLKIVDEFIRNPSAVHAARVRTYSGLMGNRVVGTYVPLVTPAWAVVTEMPWAEAYQEFIWTLAISIAVTLAVALLAGLLAGLIARRLAAPLVNLTGTAARIAGGEIDLQAAVGGSSEVAGLATAFNSMTARLRQTLAGLEQRVAERTAQLSAEVAEHKRAQAALEAAQRQLVDASREAGMAEVATSVLHNVGNALNSVNVSSAVLSESIRNSKVANLSKAVALLQENAGSLAEFLTVDQRGRQLPGYLIDLAKYLVEEQADMVKEVSALAADIGHIKSIVAMQQNYARAVGVKQNVAPKDMVEDALTLNAAALVRHDVHIVREYQDLPPLMVEKHRVVQILVNLISNAKYAFDGSSVTEKRITLRICEGPGKCVRIEVADTGVGIAPEVMAHIFEHGFTTRKEGHGFGLHGSVLAARQIGGSLKAYSDGPGRGATFILEFPRENGAVMEKHERNQ